MAKQSNSVIKILILLFDDIALVNGYTFQSLPQRKSIIREHFKILEHLKKGHTINTIFTNNDTQLNLFD